MSHGKGDWKSYQSWTRWLEILPRVATFNDIKQIDLPAAQPDVVAAQLKSTFGIDPSETLHISAKTGLGTESVLRAIVNRIPPPRGTTRGPLTAFLFDSSYVIIYYVTCLQTHMHHSKVWSLSRCYFARQCQIGTNTQRFLNSFLWSSWGTTFFFQEIRSPPATQGSDMKWQKLA